MIQCDYGENFRNGKEVYLSLWGAKGRSFKTVAEMGISEQSYKMQFGGM